MSQQTQTAALRVTTRSIRRMKQTQPVTMLTAYDAPTAALLDEAGVDLILVGDSVGTVLLGYETTVQVTMEDMIHHTKPVARAAKHALVVVDLPYLSYQVSDEQALLNAGRLIQEGGAQAVKLEGGSSLAPRIRRLTEAGIAVMGHIGLQPQSVHGDGGYRMYGKTQDESEALIQAARDVEAAGAFALVLECVVPELAARITQAVQIPTIGIGSGSQVDGQVLVFHDLVGLTRGSVPKFVDPTAQLQPLLVQAVQDFCARTREKK